MRASKWGLYVGLIFSLFCTGLASAAAPKVEAPKQGWQNGNPPDAVKLDPGRRNPLFYVGEAIRFQVVGPPANRFEVRDFWGEIVDKGPFSATLTIKAQPPGWYKLYVFGKPMTEPVRDKRSAEEKELAGDNTPEKIARAEAAEAAWNFRQWYGEAVGGTTFVVFRDDPHFPMLPPENKYPAPGTGDEVMRAVTGMGPQRHSADATHPEESIKNLEREIATDRELYLPFDPTRHRALMIAFPGGTRDHLDGVKKIVEHFKDTVTYYEPRNEPNYGASGSDFLKRELIDFHQTVKGVDPKLRVLSPGTVSIAPGGHGLDFIEDFLKAGGAKYIDGFSFHFYNGLNGDLWLGRHSLDGLTAMLRKYNAADKELWQTEQGFFACVYGAYQPHIQARWTMLEMMLFEQYGLPKENNHLWYDVSHGFWDVPTWWENDDRSFNPALPLMRVWSEELFGKHFSKKLDFGLTGNKLYVGSQFEGDGHRVIALMSAGSPDGSVEINLKGTATSVREISSFGVQRDVPISNGVARLTVPELPIYLEPAPGQEIEIVPQDFGTNLARSPGVTAASSGTGVHPVDPKIPNNIAKLFNGELECWYSDQRPESQPWMDNTPKFPAWVELKFPAATEVSRVIIYAPAPWQWQGTLLDYELQYDDGSGKWVTIEHVIEPAKTFRVLTTAMRTKVDSFFSDRHIFLHHFKPVILTKLRILVHETTWGGGSTEEVTRAGGQTGPHQVNLREIEVYAK